MKLSPVLKRFFEKSPIPVIARGMIERLLNPAQLDKWFAKITKTQYTRDLLFSTIFNSHSGLSADAEITWHFYTPGEIV